MYFASMVFTIAKEYSVCAAAVKYLLLACTGIELNWIFLSSTDLRCLAVLLHVVRRATWKLANWFLWVYRY